MDCSSCASAYAANQVTQISESTGSFSVAAFAMGKSKEAVESAILPLIEKLPDLGVYNAQGGVSTVTTPGSQLNLRA